MGRKTEWAVLPYKDYLALVDQTEMLHDVRDYEAAIVRLRQLWYARDMSP